MRGIEQRTVCPVVDVEFLAAALLYLDHEAGIFRAQRTAGLAPQFGVIGDRQRVEVLVDDLEVIFQRRRFHARIDGRKAPAHIDHVDDHRSFGNRGTCAVERLHIGMRAHRLAADVEAHAQPVGILTGFLQQRGRFGQVAAELARKAQRRVFGRHAQAHAQPQIGRLGAIFGTGGGHDLRQLFRRIEAEGFHAVLEIGFADRAGRFHRMHEAQGGLGQDRTHHAHFGDGSDVVMRYAVIPQDLHEIGRRIGLHRIKRLAGEFLDEETRRARSRVRAVENDWFVRRKGADYSLGVWEMLQFKGPPKRSLRTMKRQAALRLGSPLGAAGGAHINRGS